jgi:mono/diheme cytochrome c family protein
LFEGKCQGCHENDGTEPGVGPRLADGGRTEERIRKQVVNGSPSSGIMPAGLYSGTDLDNVVAFVLGIQ